MPPVSQAQRRWAFANRNKPGSEGKAAREFAGSDPGGKLPERKKQRREAMYDHAASRKRRG